MSTSDTCTMLPPAATCNTTHAQRHPGPGIQGESQKSSGEGSHNLSCLDPSRNEGVRALSVKLLHGCSHTSGTNPPRATTMEPPPPTLKHTHPMAALQGRHTAGQAKGRGREGPPNPSPPSCQPYKGPQVGAKSAANLCSEVSPSFPARFVAVFSPR